MQATTTGTSSKKKSIILVVEDIERWWDRTGITIKANCTINESVNTLIDSYRLLQKSKNRGGNKDKENRDTFLTDIQDTMWVVTKETEDTLANSTSAKNKQDWAYLQSVKGKNREGTLGCKDTKEEKKRNRKRCTEQITLKL